MLIINSALYSDSEIDLPSCTEPLFVTSCGHHTLVTWPDFTTTRPFGRRDYQIIYIKNGNLFYTVDEKTKVCGKNSLLIYRPNEPQYYKYYLKDNPDIYWIHFTGKDTEDWLKATRLADNRTHQIKESKSYSRLFDSIIAELQRKDYKFEEIVNLQFRELLYAFSRGIYNENFKKDSMHRIVKETITYLSNHFKEPFNADEFAKSLNISSSWLTRLFRQQTGVSPHKYLIDLRIEKAKVLMTSDLKIGEIAEMVGFTDQLYFSRVFKQSTGVSPSEYKKQQMNLSVCPIDNVPWKNSIYYDRRDK